MWRYEASFRCVDAFIVSVIELGNTGRPLLGICGTGNYVLLGESFGAFVDAAGLQAVLDDGEVAGHVVLDLLFNVGGRRHVDRVCLHLWSGAGTDGDRIGVTN